MKKKAIKPKRVWAFRISDSMLAQLSALAHAKEMRLGEYVRRVLERDLEQADRIITNTKREG